jgi:tetratricopeptide (TPR) repeat protein
VWFVADYRRNHVAAGPLFGFEIRLVLFAAVGCFVLTRLGIPYGSLISWCIIGAAAALYFCRDTLTHRLTKGPMLAGDPDLALRRLQWLRPGRPSAFMLFTEGIIHTVGDRAEQAEDCLRRALIAGAWSSAVFRCKVLGVLGLLLVKNNRHEEAQRCFDAIIDLGDPGAHAREGLAQILLCQGKEPEKALGLLEEAIRIGGPRISSADRQADRAWALALLGRSTEMDEAIAAALDGLAKLPKLFIAGAHWRLGRALTAAERRPEALVHFRAAVDTDPNGSYGRLAQQELSSNDK